jgi:epoxyqueuosine reductase
MKGVLKSLARECGFELAGVAPAGALPEWEFYQRWVDAGMAAGMRYLTDRRALVRQDVRRLLEPARSVICVGKLYNTPAPGDVVSRYAAIPDYHDVLRAGLERLAARLTAECGPFERKICVDTAPLLERALARRAGLGWIGRNTCLINQPMGSWFFLGALITSLDLEPDQPPPDRCGDCKRCVDACPTGALVRLEDRWVVDSRRCISYLTIEHRGPIPADLGPLMGTHVFGCDVCQQVCPWNRRAPMTGDPAFTSKERPALLRDKM